MKYEFHPEAEEELYEAAAFYEAGLSGLGHDFGTEVNRVVSVLLEHPELGARLDDELRHCPQALSLLGRVRCCGPASLHSCDSPRQSGTWILEGPRARSRSLREGI